MFGIFKNKQQESKKRTLVNVKNLVDLYSNYENYSSDCSDECIRDVFNDTTFVQAHINRCSYTLGKQLEFVVTQNFVATKKNEEILQKIRKYINTDVIEQILETYLYGMNVFEINWHYKDDGLFYPLLVQRDFRDFRISDGQLIHQVKGEIPKYKAVYAISGKNFHQPQGNSVIMKLHKIVKIKKSSLRFWIEFLEKFGSPWAIGKTDVDADEMAKEMYRMLNGDTAVIAPSDTIELIQPSRESGFLDMQKYCEDLIIKAILGANLAGSVNDGSYAASKTHSQIREDIALSDSNIVIETINRVLGYFDAINGTSLGITVKYVNTQLNAELAARDQILYNMGFIPSRDYVERMYNIDLDDAQKSNIIANSNTKQPKYITNLERDIDRRKFQNPIKTAVAEALYKCESYEDAYKALLANSELNLAELEAELANAIATARIKGLPTAT